jgi:hypothetical protein
MTPPIGVVCVYRQARACSAAELWLLLKAMPSHASPLFFNSIAGVVGGHLNIRTSPQNPVISREATATEEKTSNDVSTSLRS